MTAIRVLFVVLAVLLGMQAAGMCGGELWWGALGGAGVALVVAAAELYWMPRDTHVGFALLMGMLLGTIAAFVFNTVLKSTMAIAPEDAGRWRLVEQGIWLLSCFLCVAMVEGVRQKHKIILPFIELERQGGAMQPLLLDTSAIIDGRIGDIFETDIIDNLVIVPKFVLQELQLIADSSDRLKRARGRRGLDICNKMRESKYVKIEFRDVNYPEISDVDAKLIKMAMEIGAKIVTTDFNLNKLAQVQSIKVINVNDLAGALRPVVIPGEMLSVKIIKEGEESGQGVGYLPDGTMVVCEQGKQLIGKTVNVTISSVLQTSAGRMIFGKVSRQ